jgi:hypothetical protein
MKPATVLKMVASSRFTCGTNSMVQNPRSALIVIQLAKIFPASTEPQGVSLFTKDPSMDPILSQFNPEHTTSSQPGRLKITMN